VEELVRRVRKRKRDPYNTSFERLSVYPTASRPLERKERTLHPGDKIKIRVTSIDDEGRPSGLFHGYIVTIIDLDDVKPGETVSVIIEKVMGKKAMARVSSG